MFFVFKLVHGHQEYTVNIPPPPPPPQKKKEEEEELLPLGREVATKAPFSSDWSQGPGLGEQPCIRIPAATGGLVLCALHLLNICAQRPRVKISS